jgi:hypothetical protein
MESVVLDFLNSETMLKWTEVTLGLSVRMRGVRHVKAVLRRL